MDVTDPRAPEYVTYVNNRDFSVSGEDDPAAFAGAGDLGPESITFVPGAEAPGTEAGDVADAMLIVGNEVSGTTTYYSVEDLLADPEPQPSDTATTEAPEPSEDPSDDATEGATPEPSDEPTRGPSEAPTDTPTDAPDDEDDRDDEAGRERLPRTGATIATALAAGAVLVGGGIAALTIARRRAL
jgi:hypothetical protein